MHLLNTNYTEKIVSYTIVSIYHGYMLCFKYNIPSDDTLATPQVYYIILVDIERTLLIHASYSYYYFNISKRRV